MASSSSNFVSVNLHDENESSVIRSSVVHPFMPESMGEEQRQLSFWSECLLLLRGLKFLRPTVRWLIIILAVTCIAEIPICMLLRKSIHFPVDRAEVSEFEHFLFLTW